MAERIRRGITRGAIQTCSEWAMKYRVLPGVNGGPLRYDDYPWSREMSDCTDELIVGMKSAQMGYTDVAMSRVLYAIDMRGESVLYILPSSTPDASNFAASRLDPAIELSEHLSTLFTDISNVGHKRAGAANLFIRGSRSRSQLKSLPVSLIVADELEEMDQANVELAFERVSGQKTNNIYLLSTPSVQNRGIHKYFTNSSQDHFFFKCPHCGRQTELVYPECLVITADDWAHTDILNSHIICKECKHKLDHETKREWLRDGKWVKTVANKLPRGFHINQLYSPTVKPHQLAQMAIKAKFDAATATEFYNSKLGLVYETVGARLSEAEVRGVFGTHKSGGLGRPSTIVTCGVDVGTNLHVTIDEWVLHGGVSYDDMRVRATRKTLAAPKLGFETSFDELGQLLDEYGVNMCVIDANPERRAVKSLISTFPDRVKMCFYGRNEGRDLRINEDAVHVDRTVWIESVADRVRNKQIILPFDTPNELVDHFTNVCKVYTKNDEGERTAKFVCTDGEDHYMHAATYSEIAFAVHLQNGYARDIRK